MLFHSFVCLYFIDFHEFHLTFMSANLGYEGVLYKRHDTKKHSFSLFFLFLLL